MTPSRGKQLACCGNNCGTREPKPQPPKDETPIPKKQRQAAARKAARERLFKEKESYRWVEALTTTDEQVSHSSRVIHLFDREGDIAEVFDQVRQLTHTGVIVRAAHNRSLNADSERLWAKLEAQPIRFEQDIHLPETTTRAARKAKERSAILSSSSAYSLPFRQP